MDELRIMKYLQDRNIRHSAIPNDAIFEMIKETIDTNNFNYIDEINCKFDFDYFGKIKRKVFYSICDVPMLDNNKHYILKEEIRKLMANIRPIARKVDDIEFCFKLGYMKALIDLEKAQLLNKDLEEILNSITDDAE